MNQDDTADLTVRILRDIRDEIRAIRTEHGEAIAGVRLEIAAVRTEITAVRTEHGEAIAGLRLEVAGIRTEVSGLRQDVRKLEDRTESLRVAINEVRGELKAMVARDVAAMSERMARFEERLGKLEHAA